MFTFLIILVFKTFNLCGPKYEYKQLGFGNITLSFKNIFYFNDDLKLTSSVLENEFMFFKIAC